MPRYADGVSWQIKDIFLSYIVLNMSLVSRFLRSKKQDHYEGKICSYVIMSKLLIRQNDIKT